MSNLYYRVTFEQLFPVRVSLSHDLHLAPIPRQSTGTICGMVGSPTEYDDGKRCPTCFAAVVSGFPTVVTGASQE